MDFCLPWLGFWPHKTGEIPSRCLLIKTSQRRMLNIAYITNMFPVAVEPYVVEEICELRKRGDRVIPTSLRRPGDVPEEFREIAAETLYLRPLNFTVLLRAVWLCLRRHGVFANLLVKA